MAEEHIYSDVAYTALETNKIPDNYEETVYRSDYRYEASLKILKLILSNVALCVYTLISRAGGERTQYFLQ